MVENALEEEDLIEKCVLALLSLVTLKELLDLCVHAQSCLTLCDLMDCSPPGSSVHGVFQARMLEWVAISFFRGSSQPRDQTCISCVSCIGKQILYHWATWEAPFTSLNLN